MWSSVDIGVRIRGVAARSEFLLENAAAELVPLLLAEHHRVTSVGARVSIRVAGWDPSRLHNVVVGAGFSFDSTSDARRGHTTVGATRLQTLPDTVGPEMRTLLVGLNPSVYSADRGVPFARPGNRFWPAAIAAGIVTRDRDSLHALRADGVGMTDLVKRATARADELDAEEYRAGAARVASLVEWLEPRSVCFIGLTGYRIAADRGAKTGWQAEPFGGRPAYVMPNPSGINAHATPAMLVEHLRRLHLGRD
jgi:TDG/mug DNA glycosylase family protein